MRDTIRNIYKKEEERKLWEMYLSFKPKENFYNWKKKIIEKPLNAYENVGTKNKEETEKIVEESKNILKKFRKSNMGGG